MSKKRPLAQLRYRGELAPPGKGLVLVSVSVGPAGEAVAVWSSEAARDALRARGTPPAGGVPARVVSYAPEPICDIPISDLSLPHCDAQPLPGGRMLIVGSRSRRRESGAKVNATVVNADGTVARRGTLGGGIAHVQATSSGKIWVGYFDEGIFGSCGRKSSRLEPLGASGIVRFGPDLKPEWHFAAGDADPVDDCYALNVAGETAWATYYSGFPVVRIQDGVVRSLAYTGTAANALIVEGSRCALIGGHGADRDRVLLGDLDRWHGRPYRLTLPGGHRLPERAQLIGRGSQLHVFAGMSWYGLALNDLG